MQIKTSIQSKIFAFMIKHDSDLKLTIEGFKTPFQTSLLADNRWKNQWLLYILEDNKK